MRVGLIFDADFNKRITARKNEIDQAVNSRNVPGASEIGSLNATSFNDFDNELGRIDHSLSCGFVLVSRHACVCVRCEEWRSEEVKKRDVT